MQWNDLQAAAAVISSICAIVAATVSVLVWRKSRSSDLTARIDNGDRATRKHTDKSVGDISTRLSQLGGRMSVMEDGMARIEASQNHHLTAKDLSPLHEKINGVAQNLAANTAATKAMHEQLRMIQEHLMRERK